MSIKRVFAQHFKLVFNDQGKRACQCGHYIGNDGNTGKRHRKHAIQVLEAYMQEREAAVIAGLAELLDEYRSNHDIAECAAPVEGETGRQAVIDNWESIIEEPAEWLREQSKLHHERGFDYLQQARYEAWYEGWAEFDADAENPYADEEASNGR